MVWTLALTSHITLPPAVDDRRAYFPIEESRLVAYELETSKQAWLVEARPLQPPVADGQHLYIVEAEAVVALGAEDGAVAWRSPVDEPVAVRPSAGGESLVVMTKSGSVRVLRTADGALVWEHRLDAPPHAPAAIADDRLYVPVEGRIIALRLADGEPLWERRVGGAPNEILALPDRLYVGSTDNFLYCLMTRDGRIDWRWRTGADVSGLPAADAKRVYFVSFDNVLRVLDRVSGGQQWMRPLPLRPTSGPQLAGSTVVVAGQSAAIRTFAMKDGAPAPDIPTGDEVVAPPAVMLQPATGLPMIVVVTRNVARGDSVAVAVRSIEPAPTPVAPLPNAVTPAPMPATRP